MKTVPKLIARLALAAFALSACAVPAFAQKPGPAQENADDILESAGVSGGVISHVGCGDGTLTAALLADDRFLVHGLDTDAGNVKKARRHIDSLGLYGKVSAETYDGRNLPYGDNMVNLIVMPNAECRVPNEEIERVLAPQGVAIAPEGASCIPHPASRIGDGYVAFTKPWPDDIDQWTHFMFDSSGNAVSRDKKVRYPRHAQWYAGPKFSRHHDALASLSAMTSSKGRLFYIYDEGPISIMHRPSQWRLIARDAPHAKLLWRVEGGNLGRLIPMSLCALGNNVFYLDDKELHCLDAKTGKPRWASPFEPPAPGLFVRAYTPTVVAYKDVVMCMTWKRLSAHSIKDGKKLWEQKGALNYAAAGDLFAIGDKAWTFPMTKGLEMPPATDFVRDGKTGVGIAIATGKIVEEVAFARTQHHHRCYRNKATETQFLLGHSGVQVIRLDTKIPETHRWARGACQYGIMPANGYIYVPPDTCQCYFDGKINGFFALADKSSWGDLEIKSVLEKGPAYGEVISDQSSASAKATADTSVIGGEWSTYRGNTARSGGAACTIADELAARWSVKVGETPTAPVIAAGRVYLADRDGYTVHCLNAETGKDEWKYFAGGAVDSPPTLHKGRCVFGCRDGSVYCLDAGSGELAWRFKTSAQERRIGWEDRLASPLWIHGSVLIANDTVYFAAGHSSNLDRGIRVYGLDLATGKQLHSTTLASGHWGNDAQWGFLSDILSSEDGSRIGMRRTGFSKDLKKGKGDAMQRETGFLDASWFHRKLWRRGGTRGKLVVFDEDQTVSAGNIYTGLKQRRKVTNLRQVGSKWNQVGHLHQKFTRYLKEEWFPLGTDLVSKGKGGNWSKHENLQPRAMVLTHGKICVAGWLDAMVVELKTGRPKDPSNPDPHDAVLRVYSAADGERLSELSLSADPVFDGMAVAGGRLYLSTRDGMVTCFAGK